MVIIKKQQPETPFIGNEPFQRHEVVVSIRYKGVNLGLGDMNSVARYITVHEQTQ